MSWLKKHELELKRHVQDLRDNIRSNWSTTGQELGKEFRQFWPASRPQSPAPQTLGGPSSSAAANGGIDIPSSPSMSTLGPRSPGADGRTQNDFITGYTLGLIGGVRGWVSSSSNLLSNPYQSHWSRFVCSQCLEANSRQMTKSRRNLRQEDSRPPSDEDSEEESRGRKGASAANPATAATPV